MKIAFVHQKMMSFVKKDLDILTSNHEVENIEINSFLPTVSLYNSVLNSDLVFCWFGKMQAFWAILFAKILNKKTIVVAGGDDVANESAIAYGLYTKWWKKWVPNYVFNNCDFILAVSDYNRNEVIKNTGVSSDKVSVIYHGFIDEIKENVTKQAQVITVGRITRETIIKKGLALFVEAAILLEDVKFILIGPCDDGSVNIIKNNAPGNVTFSGGVYGDELNDWYSNSKIYLQASYHESFGCSVAEAMLGGCIPVVSRRAALPEVVGDTGIYIEEQTPEVVAEAIKKALILPDNYGLKARQRIIEKFPLKKRKEALLKAVDDVMNGVYG